jgi:outer membrane immunogenic protein
VRYHQLALGGTFALTRAARYGRHGSIVSFVLECDAHFGRWFPFLSIDGSLMTISRHIVLAAAAISAALGTDVARAADLDAGPDTKEPVLASHPVTWIGCYLGGNIGAGGTRFSAGEAGFAGVPTPFVPYGSNSGRSLVGGGQIGCDYQLASQWVIGIQGQADFGTITSSNAVAAFPGVDAQFKVNNIETLTARLGYAVAPAVLAYVKGGAAWTHAKGAAVIPALGALIGESADFTMPGYTVGGGLEWMFAPGWSLFAEYNYMNFGTRNVNFASTGLVPGFGPAGALADTNAIRLTTQTTVVGAIYRFQ